jgi:hypothetical protein
MTTSTCSPRAHSGEDPELRLDEIIRSVFPEDVALVARSRDASRTLAVWRIEPRRSGPTTIRIESDLVSGLWVEFGCDSVWELQWTRGKGPTEDDLRGLSRFLSAIAGARTVETVWEHNADVLRSSASVAGDIRVSHQSARRGSRYRGKPSTTVYEPYV